METLQEWKVNEDLSLVTLTPNEAIQRRALLKAYISDAMKEGRDYGTIPGTEKKSLWKPGAEKLCSFFGYSFQVLPVESVMDWTGKNTDGEPFFFFRHKCTLRHGAVLIGETEASCNSWEKKYRWREARRKCPKCHRETIYRSKPRENDPPNKPMGFYCWEKKGGCGAQFAANDQDITSQKVGMVKNEEIFDQVNTIQKMSEKRALVGTTIIACNASEFFALSDLDDDGDVIDGDFRPAVTKEEALTKDEIKAKAVAASASLRGDQGDLGPELKESYAADHAGNGNGSATPEPTTAEAAPEPPKKSEAVKSAALRHQPFVAWANTWVQNSGKDYARKDNPALADMWHLLKRVGMLGYREVTAENADDIKATLESYVRGKVDAAQAEAA